MQHTAVLLGNSSTLNKRGENPPRYNRTTPADFSLANPAVNAQTIFSFSAVMAFHEALTSEYRRHGYLHSGGSRRGCAITTGQVRAADTDSDEAGQAGPPGDDPARGIMILAV